MSPLNDRLERLKPILVCPRCRKALIFSAESAECRQCPARYPIRNGKLIVSERPASPDRLDDVKGRLKKRLGNAYYKIGVDILAPTYPFDYAGRIRSYLDPAHQIVVDLGCGNHRIDPNVIGLDGADYDAVDIVCDLGHLPFRAESVDAFVSRSVLEHVRHPEAVVRQLYRQTRRGGLGLHLVPFLFPFHASPLDFQRYTHEGLRELFREWTVVDQTNPTGPVSLMLLAVIECLAVLLSLGRPVLKAHLYLMLCALLFPIKFLDVFFVNRPGFLTMAPTILTVVQKNEARSSASPG